jgi:hypothetical protein
VSIIQSLEGGRGPLFEFLVSRTGVPVGGTMLLVILTAGGSDSDELGATRLVAIESVLPDHRARALPRV